VLREPLLRHAISEALGKLIILNEKEYFAGWRWSSDGFYLAQPVGTERRASDIVLSGYQVLLKSLL
jgi:hypothetical protein